MSPTKQARGDSGKEPKLHQVTEMEKKPCNSVCIPSVSQLVLREHCPLSRSSEESCSSDLLSFPILLQGERRGESPPYDWLPPEKRLWRRSTSNSCCFNHTTCNKHITMTWKTLMVLELVFMRMFNALLKWHFFQFGLLYWHDRKMHICISKAAHLKQNNYRANGKILLNE